jgi:hypothetical protein
VRKKHTAGYAVIVRMNIDRFTGIVLSAAVGNPF